MYLTSNKYETGLLKDRNECREQIHFFSLHYWGLITHIQRLHLGRTKANYHLYHRVSTVLLHLYWSISFKRLLTQCGTSPSLKAGCTDVKVNGKRGVNTLFSCIFWHFSFLSILFVDSWTTPHTCGWDKDVVDHNNRAQRQGYINSCLRLIMRNNLSHHTGRRSQGRASAHRRPLQLLTFLDSNVGGEWIHRVLYTEWAERTTAEIKSDSTGFVTNCSII